ncbi:MAG: GNAT family N-acetyltransferase [Flavobacteriales bacterium]|nr:GNAT family N-acetyltransferase [Flavobacteriales bacterium]
MSRFLEGEKIYLRALTQSDANEEYLSWLNDEETTRGLASGVFPSSIEALKKFVEGISARKDVVMFAICDKKNGQHIGNIKLDNFDWVSRTCELGILIGNKSYWGKGIGFEVCQLTIQYAFQDLNIRKVVLAVYENNPAAVKLYEKLGFQHEGRLRKQVFEGGQYFDKLYMGIFVEELK